MTLGYRILLIIIILLWILGDFSFLLASLSEYFLVTGLYLNKTYSLICHQNPDKLICIDNNCTLLCTRCTGIYIGSLFTSIVTVLVDKTSTPNIGYMVAASSLILADVVLYNSGIYNYNKIISFSTGLFFGSVGFLYIRSGLEKLIDELK
ncbi:MAG: hypothetical protein CVV23_04025 [Ignavibacteriae bacterium HGW-Ignavibacteriae-2]|nr:MAG: hypothetical protein CVV23_04025 [Ignavibacteriae bacterium HGW-Ignavibacteriae-2]